MTTHQPLDSLRECVRPAAPLLYGSSVPPSAVVPFGNVPLTTSVCVPLTFATLETDWLLATWFSKSVELLSSQPQDWSASHKQVAGYVSLRPDVLFL